MTCGFCVQEARATDKSCAHCQHPQCPLDVCTSQCAAPLRPHADWCGCKCGLLICDRDRSTHMAIVHPDSEIGDCFQPTTGRACAQTLPLAASALARRTGAGVDAKTAIALSRFLNVIAPGHAALVEAVGQFRPSGFHIDNTYWPPSTAEDTASVPGVNIDGDVLTAGTLERIIILAATQLAHAARGPALRVSTPSMTSRR